MFLDVLNDVCNEEWGKIKKGKFFEIAQKDLTKELYVQAMIQVYHYTKNNAINQAAATFNADHKKVGLLRFAMKHALEELGHENMVVNDLAAMGIDASVFDSKPLPATEALNGYLYSLAIKGGVIPRLGYSFWAEDSYEHLQPLLEACRTKLKLADNQLTFFVAHSVIDEKHAQDVNNAIEKWVETDSEREEIIQVAKTTLYLTGKILESVAENYLENP